MKKRIIPPIELLKERIKLCIDESSTAPEIISIHCRITNGHNLESIKDIILDKLQDKYSKRFIFIRYEPEPIDDHMVFKFKYP